MYNPPILSVSYTIQPSPCDTHAPTPPGVDQGFFSLFQSQAAVVLLCESYCIYSTTKVPNTRGNRGDLTSPLPTCVCRSWACSLHSSRRQFVLRRQHLSVRVIQLAVGNELLTVLSVGLCGLEYRGAACVIMLLFIRLHFCLFFSCSGPQRA